MDVSIIIVNYKTSDLINACIDSIFRLTNNLNFEIIVVDNATENLEDVIVKAKHPQIKLLQLDENVGFGRANNAGFTLAEGRNIICLNPDTLLINNALKILSDYLDSHNNVGACGGNLFDEDKTPTLSFRRILPGIRWEISEFMHLLPEKIIYRKNSHFNYSDKVLSVGYITGADIMFPRKILNLTGGFCDDYFMYYEETDLCKRIKKLGFEIHNIPTAHIQHLEGKSFGDKRIVNPLKIKRSEHGRHTYYKNNLGILHRFFAHLIYLLFLISRVILATTNIKRKEYLTRLSSFRF